MERHARRPVERPSGKRSAAADGAASTPRIGAGPHKARPKGAPPPRLSKHKPRSAWFRARASWPVREAPVHLLVRERARVGSSAEEAPGDAEWECIGPTNIGGRATCCVCDPANPDRIWLGAAGGGVWYSEDAGRSWEAQWHSQETLNVGALAIDQTNSNVLFCGTGEANLSADSYPGVGLYHTGDGGRTWSLVADRAKAELPGRIGAIAIDPFDRQHMLIGGVSHSLPQEVDERGGKDVGGLFVSHDGGCTWTRETFISTHNYWCHAVLFHPKVKGTIFATFTENGSRSGIHRSTDGGATWTQLTHGLPPTARMGRTSLAVSPSHPDVIYALAADAASEYADSVLGVFRSDDRGDTWSDRTARHFSRETQMSYGNTIVVHPGNPDHVVCGGVDLHRTLNGGRTWTHVTRWDAERDDPRYAHADHHALLMPEGAPGRIYDPNDGGLDVSEDGGASWTNRSRGLGITMYYDMDIAQSDHRAFGGGAQDNGTLITVTGRADDHRELLGGDGGWIVFDPANASHLFASYYNLNIWRFRNGRARDVSPPASNSECGSVWMAFIDIDPSDPKRLVTGSYRVWISTDDGNRWTPVSPSLDGSPISAIEIPPAETRLLYVGTENGGFFRSDDGGATWSANLAGSQLPGNTITRIATPATDARLVYVTVANFGHSHVFRSRDGGHSWEDVDLGQLPDVPHHAIAIPTDAPTKIYVANDVGVFVSSDSGETWQNLTRNLPNVMVVDLVPHERTGTLHAATYGRSLWRLKLS